jgi:hypothetical protein
MGAFGGTVACGALYLAFMAVPILFFTRCAQRSRPSITKSCRHFSAFVWLARVSVTAGCCLHPIFADAAPAVTVNLTPAVNGASVTVVRREAVAAFTWTTSNATVASVPASGPQASTSVTALQLGTVTISPTSAHGVAGTASLTIVPDDVLFYDSFSGTNNTLLSAHTPDLNRLGAGWVLIGLAPRLSDGLATVPGVSNTWQSAVLETTAADLTLAADWRAGTGGWPWCGLIVRYVDDNNRLMVVCDQNTLALWRRQAGNWVVVQSVSWPVTAGTTHHLQATLAGSSIQVWADNELKLQVTESFNVTATRHGLGWAPWIDPEAAYDNFEIRGNLPTTIARVVVSPASPTLTFGTSRRLWRRPLTPPRFRSTLACSAGARRTYRCSVLRTGFQAPV